MKMNTSIVQIPVRNIVARIPPNEVLALRKIGNDEICPVLIKMHPFVGSCKSVEAKAAIPILQSFERCLGCGHANKAEVELTGKHDVAFVLPREKRNEKKLEKPFVNAGSRWKFPPDVRIPYLVVAFPR